MNIETYTRKYNKARTRVTADMTVREARSIKNAQKNLWNFWQDYVESLPGINVRDCGGAEIIRGNLAPGGSLTVSIRGEFGELVRTQDVRKKDAFTK